MTEMEGLVTFFTRFLEDKKTRKTLDWFVLFGDKLGRWMATWICSFWSFAIVNITDSEYRYIYSNVF